MSGAKHCFLEAGNGSELSFVEFPPGHPSYCDENGQSSRPMDDTNVGHQHHFAFRCSTMEELLAMRAQVKAAGGVISPPLAHGMCTSCYFADPINSFALEITFTQRAYKASEYMPDLLSRFPAAEEDMFHPDHAKYLERMKQKKTAAGPVAKL